MILNDAKAKYKTNLTLLQTLIHHCPMKDDVFVEILEAYDTDEDVAMDIMVSCDTGTFVRIDNGWDFEIND